MAKNVKVKKEKKAFRIKNWMLILTIFLPVAGIAFMGADLIGQKKEKKRQAKADAELDELIENSKTIAKETDNDKIEDKESDEEES